MTVLGSVIDGFIVGNTMDEAAVAAVGLISPAVLLFSVEEMANNVIQHGFRKDNKPHSLSVRIVCKDDALILRFRDYCKGFDPRKKYESIFGNEDHGTVCAVQQRIVSFFINVARTETL